MKKVDEKDFSYDNHFEVKESCQKETARIVWADCVKGLCIVFVLLMHVKKPTAYSRICVPFFLSTFFFVSGYLFRNTEKELKSTIRLCKCFIVYGILNIVIDCVLENRSLTMHPFIGMLWQVPTSPLHPESVLWFLPCMIIAKVIFCITHNPPPRGSILSFIISLIGFIYIIQIRKCLPWHIQTACLMQIYMQLGFLLRKHESQISRYETPVLSVLCLIYCFALVRWPIDADLCTLYFTDFPIYCFQSMVGTCLLVLFTRKMASHLRIFCYVGANSLFYYAFESTSRIIT